MTLTNPAKIDLSSDLPLSPHSVGHVTCPTVTKGNTADRSEGRLAENFAVPENLVHHYVVVPSKLRLVTLAAFVLWKCKVSLNVCTHRYVMLAGWDGGVMLV